LGPGHIMNHAALPSWIGEYEGGMSERVKDIADTFTAYNLETIAADDVKKKKMDETVCINSYWTSISYF